MGRFSPGYAVQDRSGEILADAITNAFQNVAQGRQRKRAMQEHAADRQRQQEGEDLSLAMQGLHRGSAPPEAATPMGGGFALGGDGRFDLSQMAPVTQAPARYEQLTPGFYRDTAEVAKQQESARQAQFQSALAKALAEQQARSLGPKKVIGTVTVKGPEGKPLIANRYEDGGIVQTGMEAYEKPAPSRAVYDSNRGVVVDPDKQSVTRLGGLPPRQYAPPRRLGGTVSKGATFEANWKGRRYQELVRGVVDRVTGAVITKGLAPQDAQTKVEQEWQGLAKVIPADYLKAAETDPEYADYLRGLSGGQIPDPEDEPE